jgi:hypothetical protein
MAMFKYAARRCRLVDLLVVIAIICILIGLLVGIPRYRGISSKKPIPTITAKKEEPATYRSQEKDGDHRNSSRKPTVAGAEINEIATDFGVEIAAGSLLLVFAGVAGWVAKTAGIRAAMRRYVKRIKQKYTSSSSAQAKRQLELCDAFEQTPTNHVDEQVRICDRIEENEVRFRLSRKKRKIPRKV